MNNESIEITGLIKALLIDAIDEAETAASDNRDTPLGRSASRLLRIDAAHVKAWMQENNKTSFEVFTGTDLRLIITLDNLPL